jgi:hypothetical protein
MSSNTLNILGLCSNLLGTFVLAASLGFYISSLRLSIGKLEMYIKSYLTSKPGAAIHTAENSFQTPIGGHWSAYTVWVGVALIVIGFTLQLFVNVFTS